ncbi:MAG: hypothetical protein H3Z51_11155, partial [archaeon]|nr:hypothetical protein [archaeon]
SYTFSPDVAGDWSVKASCEGVTSQTAYFKVNPQELDIKILFLVAIVSLVMGGLLVHYITKRR